MRLQHVISVTTLALALACAVPAQAPTMSPPVQREEVGNRVSENLPAIPAALIEQLNRYQNTRGG